MNQADMRQQAQLASGYRFGPAVIDVETDDADAAQWLAEFLRPWFEPIAPGRGDICIRLTFSAERFDGLARRRTSMPTEPLPLFGLDSEVVTLPGWVEADGSLVVADQGRACFYCWRLPRVEVLARPRSRSVRVGLMRLVREYASARLRGQGSILDLHAAGFVAAHQGVLIVGPKQSGKTTLLAHVLHCPRTSLLANDRVLVGIGSERIEALGVPTLISLRDDTLRLFPVLRRGFPARPALLHAGEMTGGCSIEDGEAPPGFALSPAQLAHRLGVGIVPSAPVAAVLFPEISPAGEMWSLQRLDVADGAARLGECLYGAGSPTRPATILEAFANDRGSAPGESGLLHQLAARLPLFRCRLGPDAYRDGPRAWLQALGLDATGGVPR